MPIWRIFSRRCTGENGEVLGTRATPEQWNLVRARIPEIEYDPVRKILQARKSSETPWKLEGLVAVCTGGTADIPVAEEAAKTAEIFRLPRGALL